jgi:hypothetical protein
VGIFGVLAAIALVVTHIRHNDAESDRRPEQTAAAGAER